MNSLFAELIPAAFLLLSNGKRPGQYHLQNQQVRARCKLYVSIGENQFKVGKEKEIPGLRTLSTCPGNHSEPSKSVDCWTVVGSLDPGKAGPGGEGGTADWQEWQQYKSSLQDGMCVSLEEDGGLISAWWLRRTQPESEGPWLFRSGSFCWVRFLLKRWWKREVKKTRVYFPVGFCTRHGFICWALQCAGHLLLPTMPAIYICSYPPLHNSWVNGMLWNCAVHNLAAVWGSHVSNKL